MRFSKLHNQSVPLVPHSPSRDNGTFPKMSKVLLVFIHGFLGSADSFLNFGRDIKELLKPELGQVDVLHYEYETKGNNTIQVFSW